MHSKDHFRTFFHSLAWIMKSLVAETMWSLTKPFPSSSQACGWGPCPSLPCSQVQPWDWVPRNVGKSDVCFHCHPQAWSIKPPLQSSRLPLLLITGWKQRSQEKMGGLTWGPQTPREVCGQNSGDLRSWKGNWYASLFSPANRQLIVSSIMNESNKPQ